MKASVALFLLTLFSYTLSADQVIRGAFDIGSGSTKFKVAVVDPKEGRIIERLDVEPSRFAVPFEGGRLSSKDGTVLNKDVEKAIRHMIEAKENAEALAKQKGLPIQFRAVATAALRAAKNGKEVAARMTRETKIPTRVISQEAEAVLGFWGAIEAKTEVSPLDMVVWDIGGGSMQITTVSKTGVFTVRAVDMASQSMKKYLLGLQNKKSGSPNPIGFQNAMTAAWHVRDLGIRDLGNFKVPSDMKVIGIGPLHSFSINEQLGTVETKTYTLKKVLNALAVRIDADDMRLAELEDPKLQEKLEEAGQRERIEILAEALEYKDTDVGNLILVSGLMNHMNIKEVETAYVTMSDGLLLSPDLWLEGGRLSFLALVKDPHVKTKREKQLQHMIQNAQLGKRELAELRELYRRRCGSNACKEPSAEEAALINKYHAGKLSQDEQVKLSKMQLARIGSELFEDLLVDQFKAKLNELRKNYLEKKIRARD